MMQKEKKKKEYRKISYELKNQVIVKVDAQNLDKEEMEEIHKTLVRLKRKRSHKDKLPLLYELINIIN